MVMHIRYLATSSTGISQQVLCRAVTMLILPNSFEKIGAKPQICLKAGTSVNEIYIKTMEGNHISHRKSHRTHFSKNIASNYLNETRKKIHFHYHITEFDKKICHFCDYSDFLPLFLLISSVSSQSYISDRSFRMFLHLLHYNYNTKSN